MEYNLGTATEQEIIALRQMLHRAVLHSGMDVAEAAAHWNRKLIAVMAPQFVKPNGHSIPVERVPE